MIKILLVYEDYNHLISNEAALKKIGFDVLGITNEYSLNEKILSFHPDLILVSGDNRGKVKTQSVGEKLRELSRWQGKVILIFEQNQNPSPDDLIKIRADQVLVSPVDLKTLLTTIAMLMRLEASVLLERYAKYANATAPDSSGGIVGKSRNESSSQTEENIFVKGGQNAEVKEDSLKSTSDSNLLSLEGSTTPTAESSPNTSVETLNSTAKADPGSGGIAGASTGSGSAAKFDLKKTSADSSAVNTNNSAVNTNSSANSSTAKGQVSSSKTPIGASFQLQTEVRATSTDTAATTASASEKSSTQFQVKKNSSEEELFAEVDFNELMQELEGTVPSSSGIEVDLPPAAPKSISVNPDLNVDPHKLLAELHNVEEDIDKRMEKYKQYMNPDLIKKEPMTLSRIETYKAHKEMSKDWDKESLEKIDAERRKYTNFLFQKPKK